MKRLTLTPGGAVGRTQGHRKTVPKLGAGEAKIGKPRAEGKVGEPEIGGLGLGLGVGLAGRDPSEGRRPFQQVLALPLLAFG